MKTYFQRILLICIMTLLFAVPAVAKDIYLSSNIPLDSYIYTYLDKLDGLGYLNDMQTGTKPYTRMQAAKWLQSIMGILSTDGDVPPYVWSMIDQLRTDLSHELSVLKGEENVKIAIKEASWSNSHYNGQALAHPRTKSVYQPLNVNSNGYHLAEDFNTALTLEFEGIVNNYFLIHATPHLLYNDDEDFELSLESGYIKTHLGNMGIQLGKDAMWWGQGQRGSLLLTNNMTPLTTLKLTNIEPIEFYQMLSFLGEMNTTVFFSKLEDDRTDVRDPSFAGVRMDFTPTSNFTFAGAFSGIIGGEGRELSSSDYLDLITGKNADNTQDEKWNLIAGIDFRWRLPKLNGVQLYGEIYGEDQAGSFPPLPYKNAYLLGLYFPRLTSDGSWDLQVEAARTNNVWYIHWVYRDGYTYDNNIIGDSMGHNAERFYARLNHYSADSSVLSLHGEYLVMNKSAAQPQTVSSFWLSHLFMIKNDLTLNTSIGVSLLDNIGYQSSPSESNYLLSIGLTKQF